jgi:hypothetical protein
MWTNPRYLEAAQQHREVLRHHGLRAPREAACIAVSDMWSGKAMGLLANSFRKAVRDGDDHEARADMAIAATFAGMGFGHAAAHIPHANAYPYPIAGRVSGMRPKARRQVVGEVSQCLLSS